MREHGENTVRVIGAVVHNYPSSSFNESGITRNIDRVERAAAHLDRWVYYVHPDPETAITPEALVELKRRYEGLADLGCIGIAIHVSMGLHISISKDITADLTIPRRLSDSTEELDAFVRELLR